MVCGGGFSDCRPPAEDEFSITTRFLPLDDYDDDIWAALCEFECVRPLIATLRPGKRGVIFGPFPVAMLSFVARCVYY